MTTYTEAQMIAIGGTRWEGRTGFVRVYLNNWQALVGLEIRYYKSGNVSYAELDGVKISNTKASLAAATKVYWADGQIRTKYWPTWIDLDTLTTAIDKAVTELADAS